MTADRRAHHSRFAPAHHDGVATDFGGDERAALDRHLQIRSRSASHLDTLLDDDVVLAVAQRLALHQSAREGGRRGAGRGVFGDAHAQAEHAGAKTKAVCIRIRV